MYTRVQGDNPRRTLREDIRNAKPFRSYFSIMNRRNINNRSLIEVKREQCHERVRS